MQNSGSSAGLVASMKTNDIVDGTHCASPGASVSIAHHSLSFEYVCRPTFVRKNSQISLHLGLSMWPARFYSPKLEMLLSVQCRQIEMKQNRSGILHSNAGREALAARPTGMGASRDFITSRLYRRNCVLEC